MFNNLWLPVVVVYYLISMFVAHFELNMFTPLDTFLVTFIHDWFLNAPRFIGVGFIFVCLLLGYFVTDLPVVHWCFILWVLGADYLLFNINVLGIQLESRLFNPILLNGLIAVHPIVVYLAFALLGVYSYSLLTFIYLWLTKNFDVFFITDKKSSLIISLALALGLWLGSYWAVQDINWGELWNWDIVEIFLICLLYGFFFFTHFCVKNRMMNFYYAVFACGVMFSVFCGFSVFGFDSETRHEFEHDTQTNPPSTSRADRGVTGAAVVNGAHGTPFEFRPPFSTQLHNSGEFIATDLFSMFCKAFCSRQLPFLMEKFNFDQMQSYFFVWCVLVGLLSWGIKCIFDGIMWVSFKTRQNEFGLYNWFSALIHIVSWSLVVAYLNFLTWKTFWFFSFDLFFCVTWGVMVVGFFFYLWNMQLLPFAAIIFWIYDCVKRFSYKLVFIWSELFIVLHAFWLLVKTLDGKIIEFVGYGILSIVTFLQSISYIGVFVMCYFLIISFFTYQVVFFLLAFIIWFTWFFFCHMFNLRTLQNALVKFTTNYRFATRLILRLQQRHWLYMVRQVYWWSLQRGFILVAFTRNLFVITHLFFLVCGSFFLMYYTPLNFSAQFHTQTLLNWTTYTPKFILFMAGQFLFVSFSPCWQYEYIGAVTAFEFNTKIFEALRYTDKKYELVQLLYKLPVYYEYLLVDLHRYEQWLIDYNWAYRFVNKSHLGVVYATFICYAIASLITIALFYEQMLYLLLVTANVLKQPHHLYAEHITFFVLFGTGSVLFNATRAVYYLTYEMQYNSYWQSYVHTFTVTNHLFFSFLFYVFDVVPYQVWWIEKVSEPQMGWAKSYLFLTVYDFVWATNSANLNPLQCKICEAVFSEIFTYIQLRQYYLWSFIFDSDTQFFFSDEFSLSYLCDVLRQVYIVYFNFYLQPLVCFVKSFIGWALLAVGCL